MSTDRGLTSDACQSRLLFALLSLLLLVHCSSNAQTLDNKQRHLCDGEEFRSILRDVDRPACLADRGNTFSDAPKTENCSLIEPTDKQQPTSVLNILQYIHFRLIERQVYIAKELGELQLSTSSGTEYLIQSELDDAQGKQLVSERSRPVAVFATPAVRGTAYYEQLAWFLEAALLLKADVGFHIIATPLSSIKKEAERPPYRWNIQEHQSFLALYTKQTCDSNPKWVFSCKPLMKKANDLLLPEQYVAFILHGALTSESIPETSYPTFKAPSKKLRAFVRHTASYVVSVLPVDEMLTDRRINQEMLKTLVTYLSSSFGINFHAVILNKATALTVLNELETGLDLESAFERPSFFIRMPNGGHIVMKDDEPLSTLDKTVRFVATEGTYQITLQSARETFNDPDMAELPDKLTRYGHMVGETVRADDDTKGMVEEIREGNRTDAFVEQLRFKDVYNVTGVLVIETDPKLLNGFFDLAGKDKPWLVLFTVSWSPLCKAARAVWASVGECAKRMGFPDIQLVKVDCFEANEICQKLGVNAYPTVAMFNKGIEMNTYSGAIVSDDLCLYVKLAFELPVLFSSSEQETQQHLNKILALKSRAFVITGSDVPSQLSAFAKSRRFREVFIHQKSAGPPKLTAVHRDAKPSAQAFKGSLEDAAAVADYVENSHLDTVFPCNWMYLPSALKNERPLAILFHLDAQDNSAAMLEHLRAKFSGRVTVCYLNLRRFVHLNELVSQLAGLHLPALVTLYKPPNSPGKLIYRLPLSEFKESELHARTAEWLDQVISNRLSDGKPVRPQEPWKPATKVFNFVDQVYHGKKQSGGDRPRSHSSRAFTAVDPNAPPSGADLDAESDDALKMDKMSSRMKSGEPSLTMDPNVRGGSGRFKSRDEL